MQEPVSHAWTSCLLKSQLVRPQTRPEFQLLGMSKVCESPALSWKPPEAPTPPA